MVYFVDIEAETAETLSRSVIEAVPRVCGVAQASEGGTRIGTTVVAVEREEADGATGKLLALLPPGAAIRSVHLDGVLP